MARDEFVLDLGRNVFNHRDAVQVQVNVVDTVIKEVANILTYVHHHNNGKDVGQATGGLDQDDAQADVESDGARELSGGSKEGKPGGWKTMVNIVLVNIGKPLNSLSNLSPVVSRKEEPQFQTQQSTPSSSDQQTGNEQATGDAEAVSDAGDEKVDDKESHQLIPLKKVGRLVKEVSDTALRSLEPCVKGTNSVGKGVTSESKTHTKLLRSESVRCHS